MLDHVHLLLYPDKGYDLTRILKGIKGVSAKLINESRKSHGPLWQDESWDRVVRDDNELREKLQYMIDNPAKRDLIDDGLDWPWFYVNSHE
jgi:putative transposase